MDITIDKKKYIFKEVLNYEEDSQIDLMSYIFPLLDKDQIDDKKLLQMVMSRDFNERGVVLISVLSLEPKMKIEEVKQLPKPTVMKLMMECLKTYTKSYTDAFKSFDIVENEKKSLGLKTFTNQ